MAPRIGAKRPGAVRTSRARLRLGPSARDVVIVSRALADLAEFLQPRQESAGRGRVILDRRVGERRRAARAVERDRRQSDRRRPPSDPTEALMRVLGFMVIPTTPHRDGSPSRRPTRPGRAVRGRARRPASRHRARTRRS
ncbi:MAG TPA: hypothetical protein VIE44_17840 [Methylomirabilota bacterium]